MRKRDITGIHNACKQNFHHLFLFLCRPKHWNQRSDTKTIHVWMKINNDRVTNAIKKNRIILEKPWFSRKTIAIFAGVAFSTFQLLCVFFVDPLTCNGHYHGEFVCIHFADIVYCRISLQSSISLTTIHPFYVVSQPMYKTICTGNISIIAARFVVLCIRTSPNISYIFRHFYALTMAIRIQ